MKSLFYRHSPGMRGLARRILRDVHEADDAVNEVFLELWERADRFSASRGSPDSYLLLVTRSRCIDRLRRRRSAAKLGAPDAPQPEATSSSSPRRQPEGRPEAKAEHDELSKAIAAGLGELPEAQRRSLEMAFFGGLTHSEIAEQTQTPIGTVKGHIRRSLARLRGRLQGHEERPADAVEYEERGADA